MKPRLRDLLRTTVVLSSFVVLAQCSESGSPAGPSVSRAATLSLAGAFAPEAQNAAIFFHAAGLDVDRVRVVIVRPPSDTIKDTTVVFPAGQDNVTLDLTLRATPGEQLTGGLQYKSGDVVLFSGTTTVTAGESGASQATAPTVIPVTAVAPGATAARVTVSPAGGTFPTTSPVTFSATAADQAGIAIPNALFSFSGSDATVASVNSATGVVTPTALGGTIRVRATAINAVFGEAVATFTPQAARIVIISGGSQSAAAGSVLANPLVVEVQSASNAVIPNQSITFSASGNGSVSPVTVVTNAAGRAQTTLTLGTQPGTYTYTATLGAITNSVSETAVVAPATAVAINGGNNQSATAGTSVTIAPSVLVTNALNAPVAGATVSFAVAAGGGSVTGATQTTNASGIATVGSWTLGAAGPNSLTASVSGAGSVTFNATATALAQNAIVIVTQPVGATSGSVLATQPQVRIADPQGATSSSFVGTVTVSLVGSGGTLAGTTTVSAVGGVVTFTNLSVTGAGSYSMVFTSPGLASATSQTFSVAAAPATQLVISVRPNGGVSGAPLSTQPVVQVRDASNAVVTGSSAPVSVALNGSGGTLSGTTTVNAVNGVATFTNLQITGSGTYSLTFTSGTLASATSANVVVGTRASTTTLASSVNPATVGQSITFTATVTGPSVTATGTVTFFDGTTVLGTGTLSGGVATATTSTLTASGSPHTISASYGGDANYSSSSSTSLSQVITRATPVVNLASSLNPSSVGQAVTFTATLGGSAGAPTGTVTFKDGATDISGAVTIAGGSAAFTTTALTTAGSPHSVTAVYSGDAAYVAATSNNLLQNVGTGSSATTLTSSSNPSMSGSPLVLSATVTGTAGTPTGSVAFKDNGTTIGTGTLNGSGVATFTTSSLIIGSHPLTAVYAGDGNNSTSTSGTLTQVVNSATPTVVVASSLNPSTSGQAVTFTVTLSGASGTPTGTVTVRDGATAISGAQVLSGGQATVTTSALTTGSHTISATYSGDATYATATSNSLAQSVGAGSSSTALTTSSNPSTVGASLTLTATVTGTGGTPTGTVTFNDNGSAIGTGIHNGSGVATLTTTSLAVGSHPLTAVYSGDGNNTASTSTNLAQTISRAPTTTTIASSVNPSAVGQSVTFTATVTSSGPAPTGLLSFRDGSNTIGSGAVPANGVVTFTTSSLSVGSHNIAALYNGDTNTAVSISSTLGQVVNTATPGVAVSSSINPSMFAQPVTFTVVLTGSAGTPSGTVTVRDGAAAISGALTLSGGQATFTTSSLTAGSHTISASYSGDATYAPATSNNLVQNVGAAASSTALTTSTNPSPFGSSLTLTATVTGLSGTPTGQVTFKDNGTTIGTGMLNGSGVATFLTSSLAIGVHPLTAFYGGDGNNATSTSGTVNETITTSGTTTTLASSLNPSAFGQTITFTATVTGSGATPTGTVTFRDNGNTIGSGSVSAGGTVTFATSILGVGSHPIQAVYGGDPNNSLSTSSTLTQTVTRASTTTTLSSSGNPSTYGQSVTITATVAGNSPTGSVQFYDGATPILSATLASGAATLTTNTLTAGSHSITATYNADVNNNSSTSSALNQVVNTSGTTTTIASSQNPSTSGNNVIFTIAVTGALAAPPYATGMVTVRDGATAIGTAVLDGSGQTTFATTALSTGSHTMTAAYGGDANFTTSTSSPLTQTVNPVPVNTVTVTINPTSTVVGQTAQLQATTKDASNNVLTGRVVVFSSSNTSIATVNPSTGLVTSVAPGSVTFTATSEGKSGTVNLTVSAGASSTALTSSSNPSTYGSAVTLTATVTGSSGTPTGSVAFRDNGSTIGTGTLNGSGVATFTATTLAAGTHPLTAVYAGDATNATSTSSTISQIVGNTNTTTNIASSVNPSTVGQSIVFTATVNGGSIAPTGTVQFKDNGNVIGTGILSGNTATFTTSALTVGTHPISAVYTGDSGDNSSASSALTQTVGQATTSTAMTSSAGTSTYGQSVTFTGTVTGATPTGTITFSIDGSPVITLGLSNGAASFQTSFLSAGTHSIVGAYNGDVNNSGSTSVPFTQTVVATSTTTSVASSQNPSTAGSTVVFTISVNGTYSAHPTGSVTLFDGATSLGSAGLNANGLATISTNALAVGSHSITATYAGDGNNSSSTSSAIAQTVRYSTGTSLSVSPTSNTYGSSETLTTTITGGSGVTGTVTFFDNAVQIAAPVTVSSGVAVLTISTLSASSHSLTATYSGNTNNAASTSSSVTLVINQAASSTSVTTTNTYASVGSPATVTATVTGAGTTPTGTVSFKDSAGTTTYATVTLDASGVATVSSTVFPQGYNYIIAVYNGNGDGNHSGSTSSTLGQYMGP